MNPLTSINTPTIALEMLKNSISGISQPGASRPRRNRQLNHQRFQTGLDRLTTNQSAP
jgi:hypothetical protein